jgi:nucleotide-binding universal stress UspA family protein
MNVLLAVDPAHRDAPVVSFASSLAAAVPSAEMLTVSAFVPAQAEVDPVYRKQMLDEVSALVAARLDGAGLVVEDGSRLLGEGQAADVILDAVERRDPDLVLVGARGTGGFRGLGLGGVAHRVATHLLVPVAVVHGVGGPLSGGVLVCGVDGSNGSRAALRWSVGVAGECAASVVALFVHDEMAADAFTNAPESWQYNGEAAARAAVESVDAGGVPVKFELQAGQAVEALSDAAARHRAAAIVVAANRHSMFRSHSLGRVPAQLLHHVDRPVVVVHH